ncbi:MAG: phage major capsid protein [Betaproteobacteria bacterium]
MMVAITTMDRAMNLDPDLQPILDLLNDYQAQRLFTLQAQRAAQRKAVERGERGFSLARTFAGLADGKLHGADEHALREFSEAGGRAFDLSRVVLPWDVLVQRDLSVATPANLVSTNVLTAADMLRPWSVTAQAGIQVLEGLRADTVVPVTTASAIVAWSANEASAVAPSTPTMRQVLLRPKIAIGVVAVSRQLLLQSNAEEFLRTELLRTAGSIVDAAVLNGSGASGQPTGVLNHSISTQAGAALAWSGVTSMKSVAAGKGAQDMAWVAPPAVRQILEARERAAGSGFIWAADMVAGRPAYATTDMPASTLLVGPWDRVTLGLWGPGIELMLNPYDSTGFRTGTVQARVLLACDVGMACDPLAFVRATSVS